MCGLFQLHFIQLILSYRLNCDYSNSCGRRRCKTAGFDCVATGVTLYLCYSVHIDDFLLQKAAARKRASLQGESGSRTRAGCLPVNWTLFQLASRSCVVLRLTHQSCTLAQLLKLSILQMKVDLPTKPTQLQSVCGQYFTWVLQVSNNFIYQPNSASKRMLVESKPRAAARESPKLYKISSWLLVVASFYLFSPTSNDIYLPFANRTAVWSMFVHEMNESNKSEIETNCDSESDSENDDSDTKEVSTEENKRENEHTDNALEKPFCSKQYFCHAWKSDQLRHIKIRKHLRFSLCDTCVELR
jgi:hypothetical protein